MKRLLMALTVLFAISSSAQISVSEVEQSVSIGKAKNISCAKKGDQYIFTYKDTQYEHINEFKAFTFLDKEDAFQQFSNLIIEGFETIPESKIKVEVINGNIELEFYKLMGTVYLRMVHYDSGVFGYPQTLTEKNARKLLGMDKKS